MLERFGFTPTESKAYQALLKLGPSTGYGVARELGIARANVYQALESLVRRSAARKAATIPSLYAASPPDTLIAELERGFRSDLSALGESLRRLPQAADHRAAGPEVLDTTARLLARATSLVQNAGSELLAVIGPWAAGLGGAIEAAARRGVTSRVVSLGQPSPAGAGVRIVSESDLRAYWGGLPLAIVADRVRAVLGVVRSDTDAGGLASDDPGLVPFIRHLLRRELAAGG